MSIFTIMESAKREFEQERDKVLKDLPSSVKDSFGAIGFTYSELFETEVPVLIVSPYDVPPKPIREIYWFDMYTKEKRKKALDRLDYLVYHYGSPDLDDCYSFVAQKDFVDYETGSQQGFATIPTPIQEKIDKGIELDEEEQERYRGIQEMQEDLNKEPRDRKRGKLGFQELHETISDDPDNKKRKRDK